MYLQWAFVKAQWLLYIVNFSYKQHLIKYEVIIDES